MKEILTIDERYGPFYRWLNHGHRTCPQK